jgi:signal peptidase
MLRVRKALKNEYVRSVIFLAIILGCIVLFWFGLRTYLRTDYPLLAVASGSMVPTLNVGDLIIVQGGFKVSDINANYTTGDVIVFHKPSNPDELIVHRAVDKTDDGIITKGDHNPTIDSHWIVTDNELVGKVVGSIPYLGHIPLFVHTTSGITIILILIVILILLEFALPLAKGRKESEVPKEPEQPPASEEKPV